jgi:nucleoside-diphosphate-sugar epimerase
MARVLVIGGTLFIGRALVDLLLADGNQVTIMHRGPSTPFGDRVQQIRCDRNDVAAVDRLLRAQSFDVIYDNVYDWQRGTTGEQVAAAARAAHHSELTRYVFMSSVAVYPHGGPYDESHVLVPGSDPNVYAAQKADSERALFALHRELQLPVTTLRPAFVYGPQNPFPRESFFWNRLRANRPIIIPEDGARTMQFVHAEDAARAAMLAAQTSGANGHAYNLAGYPPLTQVEFVELLAEVAGKRPHLVFVPRAVIEKAGGQLMAPPLYFGAYLDIPAITVLPDRAETELGMEFRPLEAGLRETWRWYQAQPQQPDDFSWEDRLLGLLEGGKRS